MRGGMMFGGLYIGGGSILGASLVTWTTRSIWEIPAWEKGWFVPLWTFSLWTIPSFWRGFLHFSPHTRGDCAKSECCKCPLCMRPIKHCEEEDDLFRSSPLLCLFYIYVAPFACWWLPCASSFYSNYRVPRGHFTCYYFEVVWMNPIHRGRMRGLLMGQWQQPWGRMHVSHLHFHVEFHHP